MPEKRLESRRDGEHPTSRGVSGEVLYVDAGDHVAGMMNLSAAPKMADLLALLLQEK